MSQILGFMVSESIQVGLVASDTTKLRDRKHRVSLRVVSLDDSYARDVIRTE